MYLYSRAVIIAECGGAKRGEGREGAPSRNYAHFFTEIDATSALGGGGSSWMAKGGGKRGGEENMDINADAIKYGYIDYLFLYPVFFARAADPRCTIPRIERTARARFAFSLPSRLGLMQEERTTADVTHCALRARALQRGIEILADSSSVA